MVHYIERGRDWTFYLLSFNIFGHKSSWDWLFFLLLGIILEYKDCDKSTFILHLVNKWLSTISIIIIIIRFKSERNLKKGKS